MSQRCDLNNYLTDDSGPCIIQGATFKITFTHECPSDVDDLADATFYGSISRAHNETEPIADFTITTTPGVSGAVTCVVTLPATTTADLVQYADNWNDDMGDLGFYEIRYSLDTLVRRVMYGKVKISRNALNE